MELATVADELYGLRPEEFTRTRNERAKETRAEDKDLGARVAKLSKPSTAAWVVNVLARHMAEELDQVLALGASLREAQENLDGAELRELNRQRRQLTAAVTAQARGLARDLGVKVSESVAAQVEETLRAAMTDPGAARAVRTGQLVEALTATGVGELDVSAAVAVPEAIGMSARPVERRKPQLSVVPDAETDETDSARDDTVAEAADRALEAARRAVKDAEAAAATAERKKTKAGKRVAKLEARSLQLQGELEEVRRRASTLEHELEQVDDDLSSAEEKRERAEEKHAAARVAVDDAQADLAGVEPS